MELVPDTGFVPGCQAAPAGHARAEAQLLGQVLPLDAGVQDEQDAAQGLPVGHSRPSLDLFRRWFGQQRLDERPQFVRHDPRPRLTLPHDQTNDHPSRKSHDQQLLLGPLSPIDLTA